jgi:ABC-type glycerol-3-phosphate transport system permease component
VKKEARRRIKRAALFVLMLALVGTINLPVLYMVLNSFKLKTELMSSNAILPQAFTLKNYAHVFTRTKLLTYLKNSAILTVASTALIVAASAMAGYALARFPNRITRNSGKLFLLLQIFPLVLALIPLFILFTQLGLTNSYFGVILIYTAIGLPYSVLMFKGYFASISVELEEAAWIDGCSRLGSFACIIMPVSGPGIIAVAIYDFILCWNEFMIANIFLRKADFMSLPVGIKMFVSEFSAEWGYMMASATVAVIPMFILFVFFQRYLITGATTGSLKG